MEAKLAQQITFIKQFLIYSIFKDQRVLLVRQRVEQLCALTPHQERVEVAHDTGFTCRSSAYATSSPVGLRGPGRTP